MSKKLHPMLVTNEERSIIEKLRLKQVPELPDEPYTVIKVVWREEDRETTPVLMRFPEEWYGEWGWTDGDDFGDASNLRKEITDFEVLSKPYVKGAPTNTGMSHETFAESYPNEVQFHYDGGYWAGARAVLEAWAEATSEVGAAERERITSELDEAQRAAQLEAIDSISKLDLDFNGNP